MTTAAGPAASFATSLASRVATTAIASSSITMTSPPAASTWASSEGENNGKCELLGPFSLFVQAALGALAILVLVYKRWKERPQRPVKVWAFDVSKQVVGSALLHLANLLASMFSAGQIPVTAAYEPNPCTYYLLNLGIDTTLGIPVLILILRVLNRAALYTPLANPPESIESGNYGDPPNAIWWLKQSVIYFFGLVGMKTCVVVIIHMLPFIVELGDWALRWTEGNTAVQIIFVMLLFPVIMNAVQYYIIDIFIKRAIPEDRGREVDSHSFDTTSIDEDRHHQSALLAGLDDDEESDEEESVVFSDDEAVAKQSLGTNRPGHGGLSRQRS
ncbi:uncharacterized protein CIMG_00995 [Coccidioides immitis RS]|uniref:Vacuolar membrane protein n=3 Tax=Coccidioides immitis TaxID=5501 RepID=J3KI69_COCIM|nr:uncharacterized protein CIMG_00995 [Coccidioides immitis RS]EAS35641.3 hypothetical protein CIMG_00995 [Coccidioides immitis RS]KMP00907.1 vacuolar membrane protein [Coccidioides immitis RMSCC 2394]KMU83418.1 vacuolar membrane protein [Coccidioides immitis H538.4]TPX26132.1 hypothetical protein DIZ76_011593 [Coccidioides immitis]